MDKSECCLALAKTVKDQLDGFCVNYGITEESDNVVIVSVTASKYSKKFFDIEIKYDNSDKTSRISKMREVKVGKGVIGKLLQIFADEGFAILLDTK
jgi:hypothetical protein